MSYCINRAVSISSDPFDPFLLAAIAAIALRVQAAFVPEDERALADRLFMHWQTHATDVYVRGEAIYGTRGIGLVKNADGSETAKTKKGDAVYTITIPKGCTGYPVVK